MLSDHERKALNKLQRQLESQDPRLARKLTESPTPSRKARNSALDVVVGVSTVLAALAILFGLTASAVGFTAIAGALALLRYWPVQRSRRGHRSGREK